MTGQSMVEFAIVGPLFFLLVLMIAEGGLLMNAQASLDNATREAARALAVCGSAQGLVIYNGHRADSCVGLADDVAKSNFGLVSKTGPPAPPRLTYSPAGGYGAAASVTLQYDYVFYSPSLLGLGGPSISLSSNAPVVGQQ
ncbi:MAG: pilus assembly protein [Candidatus Dormibacteraeota bacterium]|nr:pilus assembly protein [Candidatus Dormibacteraeota bacterium]